MSITNKMSEKDALFKGFLIKYEKNPEEALKSIRDIEEQLKKCFKHHQDKQDKTVKKTSIKILRKEINEHKHCGLYVEENNSISCNLCNFNCNDISKVKKHLNSKKRNYHCDRANAFKTGHYKVEENNIFCLVCSVYMDKGDLCKHNSLKQHTTKIADYEIRLDRLEYLKKNHEIVTTMDYHCCKKCCAHLVYNEDGWTHMSNIQCIYAVEDSVDFVVKNVIDIGYNGYYIKYKKYRYKINNNNDIEKLYKLTHS
jgi:hypothetical protein